MKANKEYNFNHEKEYMTAGMIGLAYAIVEKFATGNAMAIILGIVFPMHVLWQMNQGRHFYKYKKAKDKKDDKTAKKELLLSTFVIFMLHGIWNALISLVSYFANTSNQNADIIWGILLLITILLGIIYIIVSIIKIRKVLKNSKKNK